MLNLCKGKFYPRNPKKAGKYFEIFKNDDEIADYMRNQRGKMICINDTANTVNFEEKKLGVIDAFEKAGFPQKGELVISGGASKSRLWTGIVAAVFSDRPICRLAEPDAPAFGAAIIAATSAGSFASLTDAAKLVRRIPVTPDEKAIEFYADKYRRYCDWALL
jgi:ribulose kinase